MKRPQNIIFVSLVICATIIGFVLSKQNQSNDSNDSNSPATVTIAKTLTAHSQIVFEDKTINTDHQFTEGKTAYDLLSETAGKNNLDIKTQQYDFGLFVSSIGGFENTKDRSWTYYVNGKVGDVAADKYLLKDGDIIEWRYEKPIY